MLKWVLASALNKWRETGERLSDHAYQGISGVPSGMLPPCWDIISETKVHFFLEFRKFFSCIKKKKCFVFIIIY